MILYVDPRTCVDCHLCQPGDCFDLLSNARRDGSRGRRAYCRRCRYQRERSAALRRAKRYRERLSRTAAGRERMRRSSRESKKRRRRVSPAQHEREKQISRDWHRRAYHGDPEYRERLLRKQRDWRRRFREQREREAAIRVDAGPLIEYLDVKAAEFETVEVLAEVIDLHSDTLSKWRRGARGARGVYLEVVDRILTRLNEPFMLEVLYPELDELLAEAGKPVARRSFATETHCARGHELTEENLYRRPDGRRECRTCRRESKKRGSVDDGRAGTEREGD